MPVHHIDPVSGSGNQSRACELGAGSDARVHGAGKAERVFADHATAKPLARLTGSPHVSDAATGGVGARLGAVVGAPVVVDAAGAGDASAVPVVVVDIPPAVTVRTAPHPAATSATPIRQIARITTRRGRSDREYTASRRRSCGVTIGTQLWVSTGGHSNLLAQSRHERIGATRAEWLVRVMSPGVVVVGKRTFAPMTTSGAWPQHHQPSLCVLPPRKAADHQRPRSSRTARRQSKSQPGRPG
jgi:hypothetical protein